MLYRYKNHSQNLLQCLSIIMQKEQSLEGFKKKGICCGACLRSNITIIIPGVFSCQCALWIGRGRSALSEIGLPNSASKWWQGPCGFMILQKTQYARQMLNILLSMADSMNCHLNF